MAVTSVAAGSVVSGLVAALRAATGFRGPTETGADIVVFDGAVVGGGSFATAVVIGGNGDPEDVQRPVRFQTGWHDMDLTMDEQGTIQCAVIVWSGDANLDTFSDQRTSAFAILEDADQALRASVDAANLSVTQLLWLHVSGGELAQGISDRGTRTVLSFTIDYRAILQVT